ncbi:MAG: cytochrome c biogenesis protein ResB [Sedimentisphaerales bacterium]
MMGIKETSKEKFGRAVMWVVLAMVVLLIFLSVYGAFLGPYQAKNFFNSPALSAYWLALMALLAAAFVTFRRLIRSPWLLLIHAGGILILAGALWGSITGLKIRNQLFGADKIQTGQMTIFEGDAENRIWLEDSSRTKELPFYIKLKDFRIEYYKPEYLEILTPQGRSKIPVEVGSVWSIGPDFGTITIVRVFENFKISIDGDRETIIDDPQRGYNPALEVRIKNPDGAVTARCVFERFPDYIYPEDNFLLRYRKSIREYISDIQVVKDGNVVAEKSIEVNHPLHFGGYHFYQSSYDTQGHRYTVLSVVSDTGLDFVYAGYLMLGVGVFWHFWMRHIFTKGKSKSE